MITIQLQLFANVAFGREKSEKRHTKAHRRTFRPGSQKPARRVRRWAFVWGVMQGERFDKEDRRRGAGFFLSASGLPGRCILA